MNDEASGPGRVLVVEDDEYVAPVICSYLSQAGHRVDAVGSLGAAREFLVERTPDLILLDLGLPDGNGLELLPELRDLDEFISVVVFTAQSDISVVVDAMLKGADNFLPKPVDQETLIETIQRTLDKHRDLRKAWVYREVTTSRSNDPASILHALVGSSSAMDRVRELMLNVAGTDAAVVLIGETGTGKGVVARSIHRLSRRAGGPFTDVNCAALPENLVESELFGHEKGAFTGAAVRKPGLLEVGSGGTVFLDEISELDLQCQSKLLKAVEEQTFRRVGGVREVSTDVRFVVASNRDLEAEVEAGSFRRDLFFRLNVFQITIAPLRDRGDDVLELARHFIGTLNPVLGRRVEGLSSRAEELISGYRWPGNVRELRNVIEGAMIVAGDVKRLLPSHLPEKLRDAGGAGAHRLKPLAVVEEEHIRRVLDATQGNMAQAAKVLGISRSTLYEKLKDRTR